MYILRLFHKLDYEVELQFKGLTKEHAFNSFSKLVMERRLDVVGPSIATHQGRNSGGLAFIWDEFSSNEELGRYLRAFQAALNITRDNYWPVSDIDKIDHKYRNERFELASFNYYGGDTYYWIKTWDNQQVVYCANCATNELQWGERIIEAEQNEEDPDLQCEMCSKLIPSALGTECERCRVDYAEEVHAHLYLVNSNTVVCIGCLTHEERKAEGLI